MSGKRVGQTASASVVVPAGAPAWVTAELLLQTIEVWQPYYSTPLAIDDAMEILINVSLLFPTVKSP